SSIFSSSFSTVLGSLSNCPSLTSKFPPNRLLLEQHEPRLRVIRQGGGVIQGAGVQPEALRLVAPGLVDGPLQKPFAQPLADEIREQAKLDQLNLMRRTAIQLSEASGRATHVQDVQLMAWIAEEGGQRLLRHFSATQPMVLFAHGV